MKGKVLVADDQACNRMLATHIVESRGYEVISVDNGTDAHKLLQNNEFAFVITDQEMPGMTGYELVTWYRSIGATIPLLIRTSNPIGLPDDAKCYADILDKTTDHNALVKWMELQEV